MCDTPPWNLRILAVERCWEQGWTGEGVRVGHLDSGVDGNHPALLERVIEFRHFDLEGDLVPNAPVTDPNGHGTHTAGTICGGVVDHVAIGIAPGARLCSAVVIEGGKSLLRVLCGLDWLLDCQVRVLSMALGTRTYNPIFEIVLARLREQGVLPVLPIGNVGAGRTASPGNYARVVSVGAVDQMGRIARFSGSSAQKPDLLAPGVDVVSARASGGLTARDGTSMAAAHVAGVAALLIQSCPDAPIEFIERALIDTAQRQSAAERAGCVDPLAALERLRHASSQV